MGLRDDADIAGATNATYTLTDSEESKAITVQVDFTDDARNDESLTSERPQWWQQQHHHRRRTTCVRSRRKAERSS